MAFGTFFKWDCFIIFVIKSEKYIDNPGAFSVISQELKAYESQILETVQQCESLGISERVSELTERYESIRSLSNVRDLKLEEVRLKLSHVHKSVDVLRAWITESSLTLDGITMSVRADLISATQQG